MNALLRQVQTLWQYRNLFTNERGNSGSIFAETAGLWSSRVPEKDGVSGDWGCRLVERGLSWLENFQKLASLNTLRELYHHWGTVLRL
jgi:hypothetical protein